MHQLVANAVAVVGLLAAVADVTAADWYQRLPEAQKVARSDGRPLFVVFRCER